MKDKDLIEEHTPEVSHCGVWGEKFALITDDGVYPPSLSVIRPELLKRPELLEGYEKESEETEVKNVSDVIEKIERNIGNEGRPNNEKIIMRLIINDLEKLDEPEVLSKKWIDEHERGGYFQHNGGNEFGYFVKARDLQNLLVPEQELPVIPKFVAERIEKNKENNFELGEAFSHVFNSLRLVTNPTKELFWIKNNQDLFARAWLDGFTEEEQKYRVIFPSADENGKGFNYLAKDTYHNELWVEDSRTDGLAWEEWSSFTEDEIRDLDKGDILFEHFAVKVEELEEQ